MTSYTNLKGKTFKKPEEGSWYNLTTCRSVKNKPKGDIVCLEEYRVLGTQENIDRFKVLNDKAAEDKVETLPKEPSRFSFSHGSKLSNFFTRNVKSIFSKKEKLPVVKKESSEKTIEDFTPSDFDNLATFTFTGLKTKARVVKVVDGDTIDVFYYLPYSFFEETFEETKRGKTKQMKNGFTSNKNVSGGAYMKQRCRLYGIDSAEKNTLQGIEAKRVMEEKYASLDGLIFCSFMKNDKYGRVLVNIFEDKEENISLNKYILDYVHPTLGKVCNSYFGGTKDKFEEN